MATKVKDKPSRKAKKQSKRGTRKLSEEEVRRAIRESNVGRLILVAGTASNGIIKWGALLGITYFASTAVIGIAPDIAGQTTKLDVGLKVAVDLLSEDWLLWTAIVVVSVGWHVERRVRKDKTATMSIQNTELQQIIDSNRSSSNMNLDGSAPEGD